MTEAIMNTYGSPQVAFVKGDGAWLTDENGKQYLDALAGIGVVALGHAHPKIAEVLGNQASQLLHTSNLYRIPAQEKLAKLLTGISGMDNAFFANSGAEANECAIKISRLYGRQKGIESPTIIVADQSFHGRTLATLTASGSRKVQAGFEPLVNGFVRAPFNDVAALENIARNNSNIVAIMIEPIQGEGGIQIPDDDYLSQVRAICDKHDWFLFLDEVQTGNARTGTYFNYQQSGILPDLVTTAKGLGNGVPIGVCLARGKASTVFQPGNHGSTFGGNPLACTVATSVVEYIQDNNLADRATELGERMLSAFRQRLSNLNNVKDIRGKGLMIGIELDSPCGDMVAKALDKGLLINVTADNVIRLLPPLVITDDDAYLIVDIVASLVEEV
ncbi:MAG: aspartate aminotransferase family protein [bacterium]|nr:aspartate aminotransferase family protein [Gammaproteobacteria bacterium]HIL95551.1 aspartate aminotransferase family protein [Pseudomonadales bacterium]